MFCRAPAPWLHVAIASVVLVACGLLSRPATAADCARLALPAEGAIVREFAPLGRFAGHWGVDIAAAEGTPVAAMATGIVTFAGVINGRHSVTIDHGGGLRTSYSYLATTAVRRGQQIDEHTRVGRSGIHDGVGAIHVSVRLHDRYINPRRFLQCLSLTADALWLER